MKQKKEDDIVIVSTTPERSQHHREIEKAWRDLVKLLASEIASHLESKNAGALELQQKPEPK